MQNQFRTAKHNLRNLLVWFCMDIIPSNEAKGNSSMRAGSRTIDEDPRLSEDFELNDGQEDRQFIRALARGLEVLRAFRPGETVLGNQEIASRTGLKKPTVARITHTLTTLGYLTRLRQLEKYQLGAPVLALGYAAVSAQAICERVRPAMQQLAEYIRGSVAIGHRDRLSLIYIQHCRSRSTITLRMDVGTRVPLATTAIGRAFLMALPESERSYLVGHIRAARPSLWPKVSEGLDRATAEYAEHGYCSSFGDWQRDVWALGTVVPAQDGAALLGLNCCVPAFSVEPKRIREEFAPRLLALAAHIAQESGQAS